MLGVKPTNEKRCESRWKPGSERETFRMLITIKVKNFLKHFVIVYEMWEKLY